MHANKILFIQGPENKTEMKGAQNTQQNRNAFGACQSSSPRRQIQG